MLYVLRGSVGALGHNEETDVRAIQGLLNRCLHLLMPLARLREDGRCGMLTMQAIRLFQERRLHQHYPDGRVDPGGPTFQAMMSCAGAASIGPAPLTTSASGRLPANVESFVKMALPAARKVKATWGVPVSVCIAQAAHETGWGRSVRGNAYFGIKGKSPDGDATAFTTTEYVNGKRITITDKFRAYKDFEESADDYGRFLNKNTRYKACFAHKDDPLQFIENVAQAGYATDPKYAEKVKRIIRSFDLLKYDE